MFPEWNVRQGARSSLFTVGGTGDVAMSGMITPSEGGGGDQWVPSFLVDDVASACERVEAAGGRVVSGGGGSGDGDMASCVDHLGAAFALKHRELAAGLTDPGWRVTPVPGAITWLDGCAHGAPDGPPGQDGSATGGGEEGMADFYTAVLGLQTHVRLPFPGGRYILGFSRNGLTNGDKQCGFLPAAALMGPELAKPTWLVFFAALDADDLDARVARAKAHDGVHVLVEGLDIQDGRVSILRDAGGAYFAVYHRTDVWDEVREYDV